MDDGLEPVHYLYIPLQRRLMPVSGLFCAARPVNFHTQQNLFFTYRRCQL